jgi:L-seryl-tRNA(Ser) seleniumtransferase
MKVNKEEMLGMYAALDRYVHQDHDKEWKMWEDRADLISSAVKKVDGVTVNITVPPIANHTPKVDISWDTQKVKISPRELKQQLRNGNPSIEVIGGGGENSISLTVFMLKPGQEKIVASRLSEILKRAAV